MAFSLFLRPTIGRLIAGFCCRDKFAAAAAAAAKPTTQKKPKS